jgi:hypothetical protein
MIGLDEDHVFNHGQGRRMTHRRSIGRIAAVPVAKNDNS